jgi:hypothetical protein
MLFCGHFLCPFLSSDLFRCIEMSKSGLHLTSPYNLSILMCGWRRVGVKLRAHHWIDIGDFPQINKHTHPHTTIATDRRRSQNLQQSHHDTCSLSNICLIHPVPLSLPLSHQISILVVKFHCRFPYIRSRFIPSQECLNFNKTFLSLGTNVNNSGLRRGFRTFIFFIPIDQKKSTTKNKMSASRSRRNTADEATNAIPSTSSGREKRMSSIFSMFTSSSSRKSVASNRSNRSSLTIPTSVEPSPTDPHFPHRDNRQSAGSQISTSQQQIPLVESTRRSQYNKNSPTSPHPPSPSHHRRNKMAPSPTSAPFPSINTQTRICQTTRPSQKFISQMPLSLALRTATIATPLPVIKAADSSQDKETGKRFGLFKSTPKPVASPRNYEFDGRSTYALVHGAILRYHSAFGAHPNEQATPDGTHFLNGGSIVCVTDAIQGFKWVLQIRTTSAKGHGLRSPLKVQKSTKNLRDRYIDLTRAPWGIVEGVQTWYLIFETPNLMTEWMALLREEVLDIKDREAKADKSPGKTPKSMRSTPTIKSPSKSMGVKSPRMSSPTSSVSESLPSSPSSSRKSFLGREGMGSTRNSIVDILQSKRSSLIENGDDSRGGSPSNALGESVQRRRQPSQQDIALTAFRISAYEDDLTSFVPPSASEGSTPEVRVTSPSSRSESEHSHSHHTALTPNLSHYQHKRASIISLQSRLSSLSSGPRTPNTNGISSSSSSPSPNRRRRALRRTISGESSNTNSSWKHLQNLPPPHPPPTGPLPIPPSQSNYLATSNFATDLFSPRESIYDNRESLILGISPVFETDTPKTLRDMTPRGSPVVEQATIGFSGVESMGFKIAAS